MTLRNALQIPGCLLVAAWSVALVGGCATPPPGSTGTDGGNTSTHPTGSHGRGFGMIATVVPTTVTFAAPRGDYQSSTQPITGNIVGNQGGCDYNYDFILKGLINPGDPSTQDPFVRAGTLVDSSPKARGTPTAIFLPTAIAALIRGANGAAQTEHIRMHAEGTKFAVVVRRNGEAYVVAFGGNIDAVDVDSLSNPTRAVLHNNQFVYVSATGVVDQTPKRLRDADLGGSGDPTDAALPEDIHNEVKQLVDFGHPLGFDHP